MFAVILELFMMTLVNQAQIRNGTRQATPDDASFAFRATIEWAKQRFPDLDVHHDVTHD